MEDSDKELLNSCSLIFSGIANKNLQQYVAITRVKSLDLEIKELEANTARMTSEYEKSQLESTEMQQELNEEDALLESLRTSPLTGRSVIEQLKTLENMTQKEAKEFRKQYDETIDKYEGKYLEARKIRIEYSSEYKNRVELEVQQKRLEVTIKDLQEKIAQKELIKTLRRQIYYGNIVAFAKTALTHTNCCNLIHQLKYVANKENELTIQYKQHIIEAKQHEEDKENTMRQVSEPQIRNLTNELTSLLKTNLPVPVMNLYALSGIGDYPHVVETNTKKQIKILDMKIIKSGRGHGKTPISSNTAQNNTIAREEATTTFPENKRKRISTKPCETSICTDGFKRSKKHTEFSISMENKLPEANINNNPEQADIHLSIQANTLAKSTAVNPTQTFIQSDNLQNSVLAIGNWDRNVYSDNNNINAIFSQTVPWDSKQTSTMTAGTIMDTFKHPNDMKVPQPQNIQNVVSSKTCKTTIHNTSTAYFSYPSTINFTASTFMEAYKNQDIMGGLQSLSPKKLQNTCSWDPINKVSQNLNQPQYLQSAASANNWGTNIPSKESLQKPSQVSASSFMEAYKSEDSKRGTQSLSQKKLQSRNKSDTATSIQSQNPRNAEPLDWEENLFSDNANTIAYFSKPSTSNFPASTNPQNLSQNKFQSTSIWDMAVSVEKDVQNDNQNAVNPFSERQALTANEKQKLEAIFQKKMKNFEHMEVTQDKPNMSRSMQSSQSAASIFLDMSALNKDNYPFEPIDDTYQEDDEAMSFDGRDMPKSDVEVGSNNADSLEGYSNLGQLFDFGK